MKTKNRMNEARLISYPTIYVFRVFKSLRMLRQFFKELLLLLLLYFT